MVKKVSMSSGTGVAFNIPVSKMRTVRVNLSPKQVLSLKKGGAITVKMLTSDGSHEVSLPEADIKKLMTKLKKGLGGRIKLNGGGIVEDFGRYIKPLSDRAIDRGIQALDGSGMCGKGMRGKGMRKGMGVFDGINKFFTEDLPNKLVDVGVPVFTGTVGSVLGNATGGPLLGAVGGISGRQAGQELAKKIRKTQGRKIAGDGIMPANTGGGILPAGVNLRKGGGMNSPIIQTGSPYLQAGAPGYKPYVPTQNPFTTNTMVGQHGKSGGKIVRL